MHVVSSSMKPHHPITMVIKDIRQQNNIDEIYVSIIYYFGIFNHTPKDGLINNLLSWSSKHQSVIHIQYWRWISRCDQCRYKDMLAMQPPSRVTHWKVLGILKHIHKQRKHITVPICAHSPQGSKFIILLQLQE